MKKNKAPLKPCQLVIFGGTGDLSHTKLIPSFYKLFHRSLLPDNFCIVGIGRRNENRAEYLTDLSASLKETLPERFDSGLWEEFKERIYYQKFDLQQDRGYKQLKKRLTSLDKQYTTQGRKAFYLATPPDFFSLITQKLANHQLTDSNYATWPRLVIEKPFGYNLNSAREINQQITKNFPEKNIYRIDHYLGKEMIQNILILRFANLIFEPLWNHNYIDNIQIISTEQTGVKKRGKYYDQSGALRDMMQNHMLQMLALTTMEPPADITADSIRQEKIKILKSLPELTKKEIKKQVALGQYKESTINGEKITGYRKEKNIKSDSSTETFAAIKLSLASLRWKGVPFYLKTGKRLNQKRTEIIVEFAADFHPSLAQNFDLAPDLLRIKIQPQEGISLQFNAKKPGSKTETLPVNMSFCQNCETGFNTPAAYEELLSAVLRGDQSLFTHWKEVKYSWQFIDQIRKMRSKANLLPASYRAGTEGPEAVKQLLAEDNRRWWDKKEVQHGNF